MSFKTTLSVFLAFALVILIYFRIEPQKQEIVFTSQTIGERYRLSHSNVRRIEVISPESVFEDYSLAKIGDDWVVSSEMSISPSSAKSDSVNQLLTDFLGKQIKRELDIINLLEYQLNSPQAQVRIWADSPHPIIFSVGMKTADYSVYLKVEEETTVFLVESSLVQDLNKPLSQFRSLGDKSIVDQEKKRLLDFQRTECNRIEFTKGKNKVICQKMDGGWQITQPKLIPISTKDVDDLLFGIDTIKIEQELELPLEEISLQIEFSAANETVITLRLGQAKGNFVAVSNSLSTQTYLVDNRFLRPIKSILQKSSSKIYSVWQD